MLIRDSQSIGYVLLAALLVVALAFGKGSAQQQLSAMADSLTEGVGGGADVSKHLQRVLVDSISPEVIAKLVKEINPVVTPNNTRLTLVPTARSLKSGTGYFENMMLFLWSVGYGVNDKHAVLGGMTLFPGVEFDDQLYYFGQEFDLQINIGAASGRPNVG